MDLGLQGRVFVVTGGSRGLGFATVRALVQDGAHVVVSGRNGATLRAVVDEFGSSHVLGVTADNGDSDTPPRLIAAARARWNRLDGGLISVGGPPAGRPTEITDDGWRNSFETVFLGAARMARHLAAQADPGSAIGLVLSTSVRSPLPDLALSNALRPALAMFAKDLADEVGPRDIRVVGLMPGRIDTERVRELDAAQGDPETVKSRRAATIPLRRYGRPEEFGAVAAFALSPAASYLSGTLIAVDGGATRSL
jgi:3-oxoacyl-[acyl-carrier protein] reductase